MTAKKIDCPHCSAGIYIVGGDMVVGFEPPVEDLREEAAEHDNTRNRSQGDQGGRDGKEKQSTEDI